MKKLFILTTLTIFLTACGGNSSNSNTKNTNSTTNENSQNAADLTESTKNADSSPIILTDFDKLKATKLSDFESYKGRTLVMNQILNNWTIDEATFGPSPIVTCKADFSAYKDAIKAFEKHSGYIHADFKGTLEDVKESDYKIFLTMKDCVIIKMDK